METDISVSIAPLLLEMMACGAMYLSEQQPATKMHSITLKLSSQVRCYSIFLPAN